MRKGRHWNRNTQRPLAKTTLSSSFPHGVIVPRFPYHYFVPEKRFPSTFLQKLCSHICIYRGTRVFCIFAFFFIELFIFKLCFSIRLFVDAGFPKYFELPSERTPLRILVRLMQLSLRLSLFLTFQLSSQLTLRGCVNWDSWDKASDKKISEAGKSRSLCQRPPGGYRQQLFDVSTVHSSLQRVAMKIISNTRLCRSIPCVCWNEIDWAFNRF